MGSDAARFCEERLRCADRCDSVPIHEKALDYYEVDSVSTDPFPNCRSAWKQGRAWLTGRPSQKLWTRNELTRMKPKVSVTNVMNVVRADRLSA